MSNLKEGFPGGSGVKKPPANAGLIPGLGKSPGEGPTPVFLPGKSHGQRSLVGYSPRGRKDWDTTENQACTQCVYLIQERRCGLPTS